MDASIHSSKTEVNEPNNLIGILKKFSSEEFTIDMLIYYLHTKCNQQGIQDYLVNKLYTIKNAQIEFYIPQLCYIVIINEAKSIERYLCDKISSNIVQFQKIYWCIEAFSYNFYKDKKYCQKIDNILSALEEQIINSGKKSLSILNNQQFDQKDFEENFHQKQMRVFYLSQQEKFIQTMVKISLNLKSYNHCERKNKLKIYIIRLNKLLKEMRLQFSENRKQYTLYEGIHLPFQIEENQQIQSTMVVRVLQENSNVYETKKRCPYKITVETIDERDLETYVPKDIKKSYIQRSITQQEENPGQLETKEEMSPSKLANIHQKQQNQTEEDSKRQYQALQNYKETRKIRQNQRNNWQQRVQRSKQNEENLYLGKNLKKILPKNKLHLEQDGIHKGNSIYRIYQSTQVFWWNTESIMKNRQELLLQESNSRKNSHSNGNSNLNQKNILWKIQENYDDIQASSPYGHFPSYMLRSIIVKGNDDLRQEVIAMQLITKFERIFSQAQIPLKVQTYDIILTSANSGIIGYIENSISIDALKKTTPDFTTLLDFYRDTFEDNFDVAQRNFISSLSAYSIICYLLQIKDRHNGNILIDSQGHIIHIDFGFLLGTSPGGLNFESTPFKLTKEYVELMGGLNSLEFNYFRSLLCMGFLEARKHADFFVNILNIMKSDSDLECFQNLQIDKFRERFHDPLLEKDVVTYVNKLIEDSYDNWWTIQYDNFQKLTNNILP